MAEFRIRDICEIRGQRFELCASVLRGSIKPLDPTGRVKVRVKGKLQQDKCSRASLVVSGLWSLAQSAPRGVAMHPRPVDGYFRLDLGHQHVYIF